MMRPRPAETIDLNSMMRPRPDTGKLDVTPAAEGASDAPAEGTTAEPIDPETMMRSRPAETIDPNSMMRPRPDTSKMDAVPSAEEAAEAPAEEAPVAEAIDPEKLMRARPDTGKLDVVPAAEEAMEAPAAEAPAADEKNDAERMMRLRPAL